MQGRPPVRRLVLWNIDLTLLDVAQVTRRAHAEAFQQVTGRPLVRLAPTAGRTDSEIFFEFLARNGVDYTDDMLPAFIDAVAAGFARHRDDLTRLGRPLPGATDALAAVAGLRGVVQTVLTGSIRASAIEKLRAFGLDRFVDLEVGGYGSEIYPRGTLLQVARTRAAEKYGAPFTERTTVYVADSPRDIEAARIGGAAMVAVASGRSTAGELRAAGADTVLADLTNTGAVVSAIERLTAASAGTER